MNRRKLILALGLVPVVVAGGVGLAQFRDRWDVDRNGVPEWTVDADFEHDVFTFVRVQYGSYRSRGGRRRGRGGWATDYPDSELNFSFRLQQLTSLKVEPKPEDKYLELTDDKLFDYPFIYIVEPGRLYFDDEEVKALRRYLLNGGFLMVDDFWGDWEWENFYDEIKKVFPDREPKEVPRDHEIFRCVYDLTERNLQIPSINAAQWGRSSGRTWEGDWDTKDPHFKAIYDDDERMMVFICHNTDLGDGWEREGEDEWYFREFSEKKAYPLGINIVTYAMTH